MEYGSFLPLEISKGSEFYNYSTEHMVRLNSGRAALLYAVLEGGYKKVMLPLYTCISMQELLQENGISFGLYNIDECLLPILGDMESTTLVLITNYFGLLGERIRKYINGRNNFIVDNTQGFFEKPVDSCYNIYSCRKFIGVSDGAYLIKISGKLNEIPLIESDTYSTIDYLIYSLTQGTDANYDLYLKNEERLENEGMRKMSSLTERILDGVDYETIMQKRKQNFSVLESELKGLNELVLSMGEDSVPYVYPLLVSSRDIRTELIKHKVFVSRWWKRVLFDNNANAQEVKLSNYLFPLPIDQRYEKSDMMYIVQIVHNCLEE